MESINNNNNNQIWGYRETGVTAISILAASVAAVGIGALSNYDLLKLLGRGNIVPGEAFRLAAGGSGVLMLSSIGLPLCVYRNARKVMQSVQNCNGFKNQLEDYKKTHTHTDDEFKALQKEKERVEREIVEQKQQLDSLKEEKKQLHDQAEQLNQQLRQKDNEVEKAKIFFASQYDKLNKQIQKGGKLYQELQRENDQIKASEERLRKEKEELEQTIVEQKKNLADKEKPLQDVQSKLQQFQDSRQEEREKLTEEKAELQEKLDLAVEGLKAKEAQFEQISKEHKILENKTKSNETLLKKLEGDIQELKIQKEKREAELKNEIQAKQNQIDELNRQLAQIQGKLDAVQNTAPLENGVKMERQVELNGTKHAQRPLPIPKKKKEKAVNQQIKDSLHPTEEEFLAINEISQNKEQSIETAAVVSVLLKYMNRKEEKLQEVLDACKEFHSSIVQSGSLSDSFVFLNNKSVFEGELGKYFERVVTTVRTENGVSMEEKIKWAKEALKFLQFQIAPKSPEEEKTFNDLEKMLQEGKNNLKKVDPEQKIKKENGNTLLENGLSSLRRAWESDESEDEEEIEAVEPAIYSSCSESTHPRFEPITEFRLTAGEKAALRGIEQDSDQRGQMAGVIGILHKYLDRKEKDLMRMLQNQTHKCPSLQIQNGSVQDSIIGLQQENVFAGPLGEYFKRVVVSVRNPNASDRIRRAKIKAAKQQLVNLKLITRPKANEEKTQVNHFLDAIRKKEFTLNSVKSPEKARIDTIQRSLDNDKYNHTKALNGVASQLIQKLTTLRGEEIRSAILDNGDEDNWAEEDFIDI